ncbi:MAG: hypothetical protein NZT92_23090 [Abditibacteriales bacterium]|nr:hypothetical protein [Abditibacteriales bacterium]
MMPSRTPHKEQAKRFETFFQSLDKSISVNREWIVIGASYATLHWLEAYFDHQRGLHFAEHVPRDNAMWRLG